MPHSFALTILSQPETAALDTILEGTLDVLFALGVVNPLGPTLSLAVTPRKSTGPGGRAPLYRVHLNPFEQRVEKVATIEMGEAWLPATDLDPLLRMDFGACPTLILIHRHFTPPERTQLTERIFGKFPQEAVKVCAQVRAHFGDPWARVSAEVRGEEPPDHRLDLWKAISLLSEIQSRAAHVGPEIEAFLSAWNGSIFESGIPQSLMNSALPFETIQKFLIKGVAPSVWLPRPESEEPGPPELDAHATRTELHGEEWRDLEGEELLDFAFRALALYGSDTSTSDILQLAMLYGHVVENTTESMRLELVLRIEKAVSSGAASMVAFLPAVIVEEAEGVVATATIEFVSYSPWVEGELYAFRELHPLIENATVVNRGAVVGALIGMGEATLLPHVDRMRGHLTPPEMEVAARISTNFVQHDAVQYWLQCAEGLVDGRDDESEGLFGICASALFRLGQNNPLGKVFETVRHFPANVGENEVERRNEWSAAEYASLIAPALYGLESRERPPKVMPHVLTAWGLTPKSLRADWVGSS